MNLKARAALRAGLTPIICVGETLAERDAGETLGRIQAQLDAALADICRRGPGARRRSRTSRCGRSAPAATRRRRRRKRCIISFARRVAHAPRRSRRPSCGFSTAAASSPTTSARSWREADVDGGLVGGASLSAPNRSFVLVKEGCRRYVMITFLTVLHVIVCVFLILVVLLQAGKGGGMGIAFGGGGGSQTVFGSSGAGNFLTRLTSITACHLPDHVAGPGALLQPAGFAAAAAAGRAEGGGEEGRRRARRQAEGGAREGARERAEDGAAPRRPTPAGAATPPPERRAPTRGRRDRRPSRGSEGRERRQGQGRTKPRRSRAAEAPRRRRKARGAGEEEARGRGRRGHGREARREPPAESAPAGARRPVD